MRSYSVRCVFLWPPRPDQSARHLFEERITLWQAKSFDEAIQLAEEEAQAYACDGVSYLNLAQSYELFDEIGVQGVEVFSLLRESDLDPEDYLSAFFETGRERTQ